MARKKRVMYAFHDIYRQDKIDDWIFAYFTGAKSFVPTAKLSVLADEFQKDFLLSEDECAQDIIISSYYRSLAKWQKFIKIDND